MQKGNLRTRLELAKILKCDPRTIAKWLEEGLPVKRRGRGGRPSLFDVTQVKHWLTKRNAADVNGAGGMAWSQERAQKEHWQAMLAQQAHAARSGELLPAADVAREWEGHIAAVRTKLLAWAATLTDRVYRASTLSGLAGVERVIADSVREVLRELAGEVDQTTEPATPKGRRRAG